MRFRSGLEKRTAAYLKKLKIKFEYEKMRIKWQDLRFKTYTPDFVLSNGIIIETKGRFIHSDRTKHLMVKAQHPNMIFVLYSATLTRNYTRVLKLLMVTGVIRTDSSMLKKLFLSNGQKKEKVIDIV